MKNLALSAAFVYQEVALLCILTFTFYALFGLLGFFLLTIEILILFPLLLIHIYRRGDITLIKIILDGLGGMTAIATAFFTICIVGILCSYPPSVGLIAVGGLTFLVSALTYRKFVDEFASRLIRSVHALTY